MRHLLTILLFAAAAATEFGQNNGEALLVGSWSAVTTPRVCATGAAITTFKATYNFDQGGTLNFVSSGTGSGGRGREQVGQWKYIGGDRYRFALKTFIFDANRVSSSYQIVTHDLLLADHGLSWTSVGDSRTYNFDGIEINRGCSSISATRLDLD